MTCWGTPSSVSWSCSVTAGWKKCKWILWTSTRGRLVAEGDAHLHIHSWDVENGCLHVVGLGLQRGGAFLASQQMGGGGAGGLHLLLLGRRLLVETSEAALTAPGEPTQKSNVVTGRAEGSSCPSDT